ncbi:MAG TPA: NAD(P)/FAD-dependent oxidoreductase [Anaerolineales bacterium]|nr:NAD(P)/FAD-dependent oxidoreductase [Anaerolineales bacterium]
MLERNIIIIGGGPAGLSTALHLARDFPHLTPRILILEKARYPRPKLCAGGLVIDAEIILQRLGLDVCEVPHADADRIRFDFEAKGLNIRFFKRPALRVIRRAEFDNWLAKKTESRGVAIREGITVRNIVPDHDGVTVETDQGDFRAQVVVGADGSNGVTRRCIFPRAAIYTARVLEVITPSPPMPSAGTPPNTTMEIRDAHSMFRSSDLSPSLRFGGAAREEVARSAGGGRWGSAYIDFFPVPSNIAGYVWDFPTQVNGEVMRCWGIYDTNLLAGQKRPQLKEPLAKEMARLGFNLDDYEIKGHPIRMFSPENQMSVPRVLLVGDAAGADPFLGEGISIALGYGALAAREIGKAFRRNDFSFKRYKWRMASSSLGQALMVRWLLAQFVYLFKWKWFQIFAWRIVKPVTILIAKVFVLNWGKRL